MYCTNCGTKARGRFCAECGQKIDPDDNAPIAVSTSSSTQVQAVAATVQVLDMPDPDWDEEVDYRTLLEFPAVRERIEQAASEAKKGLSAEEFLGWAEKAFGTIHGVPVPLTKVIAIATPMFERMGIHTGKSRTEILASPVAKLIVAALCSFARNSQQIKHVHQGSDGCVFEVSVPSSIWTMESRMIVTVRRHDLQTEVSAQTTVPGQMYDWGKSQKWLDTLFDELASDSI